MSAFLLPIPEPGRAVPIDGRLDTLARRFSDLDLSPGSPVGLRLPGGPNWIVAFMAALRAGLTPCCLPLAIGLVPLARLIEDLRLEVLVTEARVGDMAPAQELATLAGGYFGLRFPMAFGPDLPDGIEPLPPACDGHTALDTISHPLAGHYVARVTRKGGFALGPCLSLLEGACRFRDEADIRPGDRILHLGLPDRMDALATSLGAIHVVDARLEWLAPFDSKRFALALEETVPTHLVVPAAMEHRLGAIDLGRSIRSVTLLHRPPAALKAGGRFSVPFIDLVSLDEGALLLGRRDADGRPAVLLASTTRIGQGGAVEIYGQATALAVPLSVRPPFSSATPLWRASGWRVDVFAGRVIAIVQAGEDGSPAET